MTAACCRSTTSCILVPFGEYLAAPGLDGKTRIRAADASPGGFIPGTRRRIMDIRTRHGRYLICYEAIFP